MRLVFYISGHGFGHATRSVAVIDDILHQRPCYRIVVRSSVPAGFLTSAGRASVDVQHAETDTGVVQIDSLRLDEAETARRAAAFYRDFQARVSAEAAILRTLAPAAVVGDIPPLAFAAAHEAGVPSIALGNFTWDWIYAAYPKFDSLAPGTLAIIRNAYSRARTALRLPFAGGFEPMKHVTRDVPLVARHSRLGRPRVRNALDLPEGRVVVLASFGGHGTAMPYEDVAHHSRFTLLVTDHELPRRRSDCDRLRRLSTTELVARGVRYEDLVAAADVVVSKPGYGIVSECIANGAALLYTSRGHFAEQDVMVESMTRVMRCRYIAEDDLRAGRWQDGVDSLLAQSLPSTRMETTGASVAASEILAVAEEGFAQRL
jgi:L-arabinokinase